MFLLLFTFAFGLVLVSAHETGAPIEACGDFKTEHHIDHDPNKPLYEAQTSTAPYKISLNPTSIAPGGQVQITIAGDNGKKFKGFMIQGKDKSRKIVGSFLNQGKGFQTLDCGIGDPGDTATHTDPDDKGPFDLIWKAPEDFTGEVVFEATIVKEYETFWYGVKSSPLAVV